MTSTARRATGDVARSRRPSAPAPAAAAPSRTSAQARRPGPPVADAARRPRSRCSWFPESFNRPFAVPTGVALIGLGVSLWRDQRRQAETSTR